MILFMICDFRDIRHVRPLEGFPDATSDYNNHENAPPHLLTL